ncbi:hypothetical protein MJO28_017604 [Puccinia striiformis f. sp. tritici]|nr:hypothetical protein MJO28_017604 [Puccinia striiformis f. sp. tritici]
MLRVINALLPRIHYPTWIKRAIPVLGKAANGKLKADEWRHLFVMQLPLILVKVWHGPDRSHRSLLQNFAHLVSAVNLALKRSMTTERMVLYSHHIKQYLTSSLTLFPHCGLAPNHHMSMHLPECLARFGPVRSWWSFPMERLMGEVLHSSHNNRLGQLEITFLKAFCRAGNLRALLNTSELFPEDLRPYIDQLKELFETTEFTPKHIADPIDSEALSSLDSQKLIDYLNAKSDDESWALASEWTCLSDVDKKKTQPLPSQYQAHRHFYHNNVYFSTMKDNPNNSVISIDTQFPKLIHFAQIETIFTHRRTTNKGQLMDTWLKVKPFAPLPSTIRDVFAQLDQPHLQLHLRLPVSDEEYIINIKDIVAHCAWIEYKAGELVSSIRIPTTAMVVLDRE